MWNRQAQLKLMFDELDEDGSGELTLDEINAAPAVPWIFSRGQIWRELEKSGFEYDGFVWKWIRAPKCPFSDWDNDDWPVDLKVWCPIFRQTKISLSWKRWNPTSFRMKTSEVVSGVMVSFLVERVWGCDAVPLRDCRHWGHSNPFRVFAALTISCFHETCKTSLCTEQIKQHYDSYVHVDISLRNIPQTGNALCLLTASLDCSGVEAQEMLDYDGGGTLETDEFCEGAWDAVNQRFRHADGSELVISSGQTNRFDAWKQGTSFHLWDKSPIFRQNLFLGEYTMKLVTIKKCHYKFLVLEVWSFPSGKAPNIPSHEMLVSKWSVKILMFCSPRMH